MDYKRKNASGHGMVQKGENANHTARVWRTNATFRAGTFVVPSKILQYASKLSGTSEDVDDHHKTLGRPPKTRIIITMDRYSIQV